MKPISLITTAQFAAALGVEPRTVNSWVSAGKLVPALKPNPRMHLFDARDVEKFRVRAKPGPRPDDRALFARDARFPPRRKLTAKPASRGAEADSTNGAQSRLPLDSVLDSRPV